MRIFLDSSVLIAASGSSQGASFAVVYLAAKNKWRLLASPYCLGEVERNIGKLGCQAQAAWEEAVRPTLAIVADVLSMSKPLLLEVSKDKPPLLSAIAAHARFFLTLDQQDFARVLGTSVYGVAVLAPGDFIEERRHTKQLQV